MYGRPVRILSIWPIGGAQLSVPLAQLSQLSSRGAPGPIVPVDVK